MTTFNLDKEVSSIVGKFNLLEELRLKEQAYLIIWFAQEMLDKKYRNVDVLKEKVIKVLSGNYCFEDVIQAMWNCSNNKFFSGQNDREWQWSLDSYILNNYKTKSSIDKALTIKIDMNVTDKKHKAYLVIKKYLKNELKEIGLSNLNKNQDDKKQERQRILDEIRNGDRG